MTRRDRADNRNLRLLLAFCSAPGWNCVDVGSHRGHVLEEMVRLCPGGRHVAFEPLPDLASGLRARFQGVEVRESAVSDEAGSSSFFHVLSAPGLSGLRQRDFGGRAQQAREIAVRVERLDDCRRGRPGPQFIKIDVEGAELQVLRGGLETLRRHRPMIWFEHGSGAADVYGTEPQMVYELLTTDAKLRVFDADGHGPLTAGAFTDRFDGRIWTYLARP